MNVGIAASSGDLVAQLHSDDFYLAPDVLSLVNSAMSASNAGWCFGRIKKVINGQLVSESYVAPHFSPVQLLKGNFIPHPATFVRRDWLLAAGGFDETLKYAMDYDLWLRLAKVGKPLELGQPLAAFRVHSGSLSSSNRLAAMAEDFSIRLTYTGPAPIARLEHYLRYWVRRRRAVTQLRATIADGMAT